MASISWSKSMAEEIIKAGYRQLTKKFHPDAGGSHDEMIVLKVTAEHLQASLDGTKGSARTEETNRRSSWGNRRQKPPEPEPESEIPLKEYAYGWYTVEDTICVRVSEKAIQVKFPGVAMPQWLPKSQLHTAANQIWDEDEKGDCVFSRWIAQQKGWA